MTRDGSCPSEPTLRTNLSILPVILLVGGKGTRLAPVSGGRPKCLMPVARRPFLAWQLDYFLCQGIRKFILATGCGAREVEAFARAYLGDRGEITVSRETRLLGTGGAIRQALMHVDTVECFAANGDTFLLADLRRVLNEHRRRKARATIVVKHMAEIIERGSIRRDQQGWIRAFEEKRRHGGGWFNGGVYLLGRDIFDRFGKGEVFSLEHDLFPRLAGTGLLGVATRGAFLDIGTPHAWRRAALWLKENWRASPGARRAR